ncbi:hypothetical protein [Brucella pituitosa]|uniref:hypothetical protein n=1 Tax=Brucella pituitosa TaxID=571256 RepID=UPI003F4AB466
MSQSETADILSSDQLSMAVANGDDRISKRELMDRVMQDYAAVDKSGEVHLPGFFRSERNLPVGTGQEN